MAEFRFSTNVFGLRSRGDFVDVCRRAEGQGYDTVFAADHLGVPSPFPLLVAAAEATERLRVGTLVLNAAFWNPALLARDIATTDVLTDGRLELGLGSGHMRWEFDAAGVPWEPFGARADRLAATIEDLGRLFAQDGYAEQAEMRDAYGMPVLRPVQRRGFGGHGPPLIVGGTGDRVLDVAGRHADIISVAGVVQVPGQPPGTFRVCTAEEADERVHYARERAGARADDVEWHVLTQTVVVTEDRRAAADEIAAQLGAGSMSAEQLLDTPFALIGDVDQMAEQIVRNRDRFGFTYYTVHAPYRDTFAPVMERVRRIAEG